MTPNVRVHPGTLQRLRLHPETDASRHFIERTIERNLYDSLTGTRICPTECALEDEEETERDGIDRRIETRIALSVRQYLLDELYAGLLRICRSESV